MCRDIKFIYKEFINYFVSEEKGSPEGGANGYLPAKVPITITANPMHGEV